jgi:hypothetical protein
MLPPHHIIKQVLPPPLLPPLGESVIDVSLR